MTSFRLGARQLVLPVLLGCLTATVLLYTGLAVSGDAMAVGELTQILLTALVSCVVVALTARGQGVSLTEEALVFRGDRRPPIPRAAILRLEIQRSLGVGRVVLYTAGGRRTVLRAPMSFLDREFDRKAQIITEWWRGSDRQNGRSGSVAAPVLLAPVPHKPDDASASAGPVFPVALAVPHDLWKATMLLSLLPTRQGPRFAIRETCVTLFAAFCWRVLAFAMYAEGYDLDESAPVQVTGDEEIAALALLFALSVPLTWLLRLVPWHPFRTTVDSVVALRLIAVAVLSAVMFFGLITNIRIPLVGWVI